MLEAVISSTARQRSIAHSVLPVIPHTLWRTAKKIYSSSPMCLDLLNVAVLLLY